MHGKSEGMKEGKLREGAVLSEKALSAQQCFNTVLRPLSVF